MTRLEKIGEKFREKSDRFDADRDLNSLRELITFTLSASTIHTLVREREENLASTRS